MRCAVKFNLFSVPTTQAKQKIQGVSSFTSKIKHDVELAKIMPLCYINQHRKTYCYLDTKVSKVIILYQFYLIYPVLKKLSV